MADATLAPEKVCADCKVSKPREAFGPSKQSRDGLYSYCYECRRVQRKAEYASWTPRQREMHHARTYRGRYGVTLEFVRDLYQKQEGCCRICGIAGLCPAADHKRTTRKHTLCIDHDHETGEVRGLLCAPCNQGLGHFRDSRSLLIKALAYLEEEH